MLKQKLSVCTPAELLPTTVFISCSCGPVEHIIDQRYEEKSVAKEKKTIIPSLAKKCSADSNQCLIM